MNPEPHTRRPSVLLAVATTLVAIAAVAGIYYFATRLDRGGGAEEPKPGGGKLVEGNDYRVLIAVVRVNPTTPDGDAWDSGSEGSRAPDPFCQIWWRDNLVYESEEVSNVLVASWSNLALPNLYELLAGDKLSFESIKEGALITARAGDKLRVRISDVDSLKNDLIEEFEVSVDELRVGDQVREGKQGLESLTLRVIPRDSSELKHLIQ